MMATIIVSCAIVWPIPNRALVLQSNGQHYWTTYVDNGEHIRYARPVHNIVKSLVEEREGRAARVGCELSSAPWLGRTIR